MRAYSWENKENKRKSPRNKKFRKITLTGYLEPEPMTFENVRSCDWTQREDISVSLSSVSSPS